MMASRAPAEYPARTDRLRPNAADVEFLARQLPNKRRPATNCEISLAHRKSQ